MLNIIFQSLLSLNCQALSWKCDYSIIEGPSSTHVLYKEENANIVKWLEKYEYCRAKGNTSIYVDAGKDKCEYSRDICIFYNDQCIINENRQNDPLQECQDLLNDNVLSYDLDSGRIKQDFEETIEEIIEEETETIEEIIEEETETIEEITEECTEEETETTEEETETTEETTEEEIKTTEEITEEETETTEEIAEYTKTTEETETETRYNIISAGKSNKISLLIFLIYVF
jgi:DNA repair exonuclease SbcCD nuclease subunit